MFHWKCAEIFQTTYPKKKNNKWSLLKKRLKNFILRAGGGRSELEGRINAYMMCIGMGEKIPTSHIDDFRVGALRTICSRRGLSSNGSKSELVARINSTPKSKNLIVARPKSKNLIVARPKSKNLIVARSKTSKLEELRSLSRKYGISDAGKKAEVEARIEKYMAYMSNNNIVSLRDSLEFKNEALRNICKKRGLTHTGDKYELVMRLNSNSSRRVVNAKPSRRMLNVDTNNPHSHQTRAAYLVEDIVKGNTGRSEGAELARLVRQFVPRIETDFTKWSKKDLETILKNRLISGIPNTQPEMAAMALKLSEESGIDMGKLHELPVEFIKLSVELEMSMIYAFRNVTRSGDEVFKDVMKKYPNIIKVIIPHLGMCDQVCIVMGRMHPLIDAWFIRYGPGFGVINNRRKKIARQIKQERIIRNRYAK